MHVMTNDPHEREHTTTQDKSTQGRVNPKALVTEDQDFPREIVREALQQILEAEIPTLQAPSRKSTLRAVRATARSWEWNSPVGSLGPAGGTSRPHSESVVFTAWSSWS